LGLSFILHIWRQYENPRKIRKILLPYKERHKIGNEKEKNKHVDVDMYATNEMTLEHIITRAWSVRGCTSLVAQNASLALDIFMEDMSVHL
jgi:hypothetical protein